MQIIRENYNFSHEDELQDFLPWFLIKGPLHVKPNIDIFKELDHKLMSFLKLRFATDYVKFVLMKTSFSSNKGLVRILNRFEKAKYCKEACNMIKFAITFKNKRITYVWPEILPQTKICSWNHRSLTFSKKTRSYLLWSLY